MKYLSFNLFAVAILLFGSLTEVFSQEKSVRPGINKSFEDPDVEQFIGRFEREGRDAFDHQKEILTACRLKPGMQVADIGAGTGLFTRSFASVVGEKGKIYSVDISKKFLDHIEQTAKKEKLKNIETVLCDQKSVKLPPKSIDLAFICDTYHHFEFPQSTLKSIYRALKADGEIVLIDFQRIEGKSPQWILDHVRAGQEVFTREIQAAGFKQVEEQKFLKESYFLRFAKSKK